LFVKRGPKEWGKTAIKSLHCIAKEEGPTKKKKNLLRKETSESGGCSRKRQSEGGVKKGCRTANKVPQRREKRTREFAARLEVVPHWCIPVPQWTNFRKG